MVAIGSDVAFEEVFVGSRAAAAGVAGWEEARGGGGLESHNCAARVLVTYAIVWSDVKRCMTIVGLK